ncbi:MAG: hypothetical protein Kow0090_18000 [Myxococcota bacterium]
MNERAGKSQEYFRGVVCNPFHFPPLLPNTPLLHSRFPINMPDVSLVGLAAAAEPYRVDVVDGWNSALRFKDFIRGVSKYQFVGIRAISSYTALQAHSLAAAVKARSPETLVILGGHHATLYHRKWLESAPEVDAVVRGEGEATFKEICDAIYNRRSFEGIAGVTWRDSHGKIRVERERELIANLDSIPFPRFDLWEEDRYFIPLPVAGKSGAIEASRGCDFACGFCAVAAMWHKTHRWKSSERVIAEMEKLYANGYRKIGFADDNFNSDPNYTLKLCSEIKRRFPLLKWGGMMSAKPFIEEPSLAGAMADAGCKIVVIGFENVESAAVCNLHKGEKGALSEGDYKRVFKALSENGIIVVGLFIYGYEGETRDDLYALGKLSREVCHFAGIQPYEVIHGAIDHPGTDDVGVEDFYKVQMLYSPRVAHTRADRMRAFLPNFASELKNALSLKQWTTLFYGAKSYYGLKALSPFALDDVRFTAILHDARLPKKERLQKLVSETLKAARQIQ